VVITSVTWLGFAVGAAACAASEAGSTSAGHCREPAPPSPRGRSHRRRSRVPPLQVASPTVVGGEPHGRRNPVAGPENPGHWGARSRSHARWKSITRAVGADPWTIILEWVCRGIGSRRRGSRTPPVRSTGHATAIPRDHRCIPSIRSPMETGPWASGKRPVGPMTRPLAHTSRSLTHASRPLTGVGRPRSRTRTRSTGEWDRPSPRERLSDSRWTSDRVDPECDQPRDLQAKDSIHGAQGSSSWHRSTSILGASDLDHGVYRLAGSEPANRSNGDTNLEIRTHRPRSVEHGTLFIGARGRVLCTRDRLGCVRGRLVPVRGRG
jgi:hypothetical protein